MQKVEYTMDDKIQAVQELVDALGKSTTVTEENMMRQFGLVVNSMIDELGHDKTKKGEKVANDRFAQYMHFEFLPQYSKMLGFCLSTYQADLKKKIAGNLYL